MAKAIDIDWIQTSHTITCTKSGCNITSTIHQSDEYDAALEFAERGWKSTEMNCYCPKHNKDNRK